VQIVGERQFRGKLGHRHIKHGIEQRKETEKKKLGFVHLLSAGSCHELTESRPDHRQAHQFRRFANGDFRSRSQSNKLPDTFFSQIC